MHHHILGICGTFMAGLAVLATELGIKITGSDQNVYPPMSTQLNNLGIEIFQGYDDLEQLQTKPDQVVVGNVMRRGMPVVEALLNQDFPLISGPEWLSRFVLKDRHVLAVSGTHGKTTTSSMLAWILEFAGLNPGFLIGGVPNNFGISAKLGTGKYFVVEADEYDCAFFDKRSKFIHYHPRTLIINNIEFDHADIFADLAAIQLQFHYLVRTVPGEGLIIHPAYDKNVREMLQKGCWTNCVGFDNATSTGNPEQTGLDQLVHPARWTTQNNSSTHDEFEVCLDRKPVGKVQWSLIGHHNVQNALAAIAAAHHVGVELTIATQALSAFQGVKRRMEIKGVKEGVTVYDDFAHHPTAIATTLEGLRAKVGANSRIIAVLDIRSNTMRLGHHQPLIPNSLKEANVVYLFDSSNVAWDVSKIQKAIQKPGGFYQDVDALLQELTKEAKENDHLLFMSNGGFGGIHARFLEG